MLPSGGVVPRVPVGCFFVAVVAERHVWLELVSIAVPSWTQVRRPIVHGQIRQGIRRAVGIRSDAVGVGLAVGQRNALVVVIEGTAGGAVIAVPHTVGHENVVAGAAGVDVCFDVLLFLLRISFVGIFFPSSVLL